MVHRSWACATEAHITETAKAKMVRDIFYPPTRRSRTGLRIRHAMGRTRRPRFERRANRLEADRAANLTNELDAHIQNS